MRQKKTRMELHSLYDHTGLAAHLEKMAEKGWLLEKIGTFGWTYRRCEPMQVRFAVTYFPKASAYEAEPSEEEQTFQSYCREAGWQLAASSAQLQVFYHKDPDCTPLETDALTQVENLHAAGRKTFLWANFLYLGLAIFELLIIGATKIHADPISLFTTTAVPLSLLIWLLLGVLSTVELVTYYRWRGRALRLAEETGAFLPTKSRPWMQKAVLLLVGVGYLLWLASLQNGMAVYVIVLLFAMLVLIAAVNGVRLLMKKWKVSKTMNKVITIAVDVVLAVALIFGLTNWAVKTGFTRQKPVDTYLYHGREREVYADPLPLYVDDLLEADRANYSCEITRNDRGLFGWAYIGLQAARRDRDGDLPEMQYYVVEVGSDWAFEVIWKERLEAYGGVTTEADLSLPWSSGLVAIDPAPWKADAVYRQYWDQKAREVWVIRWGNRFTMLDLDWEPTPEQIAVIAEKLSVFQPGSMGE